MNKVFKPLVHVLYFLGLRKLALRLSGKAYPLCNRCYHPEVPGHPHPPCETEREKLAQQAEEDADKVSYLAECNKNECGVPGCQRPDEGHGYCFGHPTSSKVPDDITDDLFVPICLSLLDIYPDMDFVHQPVRVAVDA